MVSESAAFNDRFGFGRNWASYARLIGEQEIRQAMHGLTKLVGEQNLTGRTFLDIGSGSGLHALAATRLGVTRLLAVDVDPDSVATTRETLTRFAREVPWTAEHRSILDMSPTLSGVFDVVYSWGVLHHTGDMMTAIDRAAALVAPSGLFAFALYRRTRLDWFWIREKRWYINASPWKQRAAQQVFTLAYRLASILTGRSAQLSRGMEYWHDLADWLGGYPYESISPTEVDTIMGRLGFVRERAFTRPLDLGLFGSGCDEYVYRRRPT